MYEEPKIIVLYFSNEDVIRTSGNGSNAGTGWNDENVDQDGWT